MLKLIKDNVGNEVTVYERYINSQGTNTFQTKGVLGDIYQGEYLQLGYRAIPFVTQYGGITDVIDGNGQTLYHNEDIKGLKSELSLEEIFDKEVEIFGREETIDFTQKKIDYINFKYPRLSEDYKKILRNEEIK